MTISLTVEQAAPGREDRHGPPVGRAFIVFGGAIVALLGLVGAEVLGLVQVPVGTSSQFGVVASTTFAIAGILAAYRAVAIRNGWAAAVSAVALGPGAMWSWSTFVVAGAGSWMLNSLVVLAATSLSIVLLSKGLQMAHWLEVFGGLGAFGLGAVAALVRVDPGSSATALPALLAAVSGMTCLYGLLVDVEMAEHRSLLELVESRKRIEDEVTRVEDLLHDLRSGLLAIEAAIGTFDEELAGPLRSEAARLRRLTLAGARTAGSFELSGPVRNLVVARRAGGAEIELRGPGEVTAWGQETEVLSIVDNLVSNAERHGEGGPIVVEISQGDGTTRLSVTNRGQLPDGDPEAVFRRGVTTHPDGQGLGLARARMLAGINGGELRLGPAEPGHTTFVLNLRSRAPAAAVA